MSKHRRHGTNLPANQPHGGGNQQRVQIQQRKLHVGPIPDPADLEQYDRISPGAADRIIRMAETQATHSQAMERDSLQANIAAHKEAVKLQRRGQYSAVLIVLVGMGLATYSALHGHDWFAGAVVTSCIGGIVASFLGARPKPSTPQS